MSRIANVTDTAMMWSCATTPTTSRGVTMRAAWGSHDLILRRPAHVDMMDMDMDMDLDLDMDLGK
eukprot:6586314-Prymnesium_polylepis.1